MENEILLTKVNSLSEAKMLVEILQNNGIPSYYKNNSVLQVFEHIAADDNQEQLIFVSEENDEKARKLVTAYTNSDNQQYDDIAEKEYNEDIAKRKKTRKVVIGLITVVAVAFLGIVAYLVLH